jgi:CrcB protein
MVINVTGSLLIGLIMGLLLSQGGLEGWRLLLVVGVLGGYTTFSSFSYELTNLLRERDYLYAAAYAFGSVLLGLMATMIGLLVARAVIKS